MINKKKLTDPFHLRTFTIRFLSNCHEGSSSSPTVLEAGATFLATADLLAAPFFGGSTYNTRLNELIVFF